MSGQIYKPVFGLTATELTVTDHTEKALNILTQSAQSIGDFAHTLLMIAIVGAHPIWVAFLVSFMFFN